MPPQATFASSLGVNFDELVNVLSPRNGVCNFDGEDNPSGVNELDINFDEVANFFMLSPQNQPGRIRNA